MTYVALYRQWRPQDFENLVGQEHIGTTLKNAVTTRKIAHAYLFSGSRGTGKTSTAKILAKALNCQDGPTPAPCNKCLSCRQINSGSSMDVFEIDAASNRGIDEIRELRETVKFSPVEGKYKVYIIDEVHMLTTEAFNALLKTLEEPPAHVVFILATTEPHKIPATIHSRCQRYDFRRIGVKQIQDRLSQIIKKAGINITLEALGLIAVKADGSMRDALSILDQCTAFDSKNIDADLVRQLLGLIGFEFIWTMVDAIAQKDAETVLKKTDELINLGKDVRQLLLEIALYMRELMIYKAAPDLAINDMDNENKSELARQSSLFSHEEIVKMLELLHETINESRWALEPRIQAEMALISICRLENRTDIAGMEARIAALEAKLTNTDFIKSSDKKVSTPKLPVKNPVTRETSAANGPSEPLVGETIGETVKEIKKETGKEITEPEVNKEVRNDKNDATDSSAQNKADLSQIWAAVLNEIMSLGKRSVHACIMQGQLTRLADGEARLEFIANFPKERTEKEDFRVIVEKALAKVVGRQVRLVCTVVSGKTIREQDKEADNLTLSSVPIQNDNTKEEHPALAKAKDIFGGKMLEHN